MNNKRIKIIPVVFLSLVSLLFGVLPGNIPEGSCTGNNRVRVVKVNDGDTITIMLDGRSEKVRLIGIDAPEMGQRPWGSKAKEHLKMLLLAAGGNVTLEYDVEKRDKYGRLLAYVISNDYELLNTRMIKDGYAVLLTFPPNVRHLEEFKEAQRHAREKRIGIWGKNGLRQPPVEYRRENPRRV